MRKPLASLAVTPWTPPRLTKRTANAVKALHDCTANEHQQKIAWEWLMEITGVRDLEFRPDERASIFASGKRFVGLQLVKPVAMTGAMIEKLDEA